MFKVIIIMLCGVLFGRLFRQKSSFVPKLITVLIWALLFLLGLEVGSNPKIIGSLHDLGLEGLLIAVLASLGSAVMALLLWKYVQKREEDRA